jgi:hypothetical protein
MIEADAPIIVVMNKKVESGVSGAQTYSGIPLLCRSTPTGGPIFSA